ncbi:MAG TPA: hemerythrin domain-containing protein [Micromonosporaceae bacterium]
MTPTHIMGEDVVDVLLEDHREFEKLLARLRSGFHRGLTGVLTAALVRHAIAEEEYVYPTLREHSVDGDRVADRGMAQHAQLAETIQQLDTTQATDAEHQRLIAALGNEARRHIRHDRVEMFPRLRATCTRSHLTWLGERVAGLRHAGQALAGRHRTVEAGSLIEEVRSALAERSVGDTK